jgi:hypothetical protein
MRTVGIIALVSAGCLSTPSEAPVDAATDAGPDQGCGRDPRPATACHAVGNFTAGFYSWGGDRVFRQAVVDDVNADGRADLLVVSNTPGFEEIQVLLGPIDPDDPQVHAAIDTGLEVGDVEVRQLPGTSPCPDLTVFGRSGGTGRVQIWQYDGAGGVMYPGPPLTTAIDFEPGVGQIPTLAAWSRLHDGSDDLLVADLYNLAVVHVDGDLSGFASAPESAIFHSLDPDQQAWDSINGVDPAPTRDCARDRVFVAENNHGHFVVDSGTGALEGGPQSTIPKTVTLGTARVDLDGAQPADILVGGTQGHGAYLLSYDAAGEVVIDIVNGDLGYSPVGTDFWIDGIAVGDLGGGPEPDWVGIDYEPGSSEARAVLVDTLAVNGATLDGDPPQTFTGFPADFVPRGVVIADLQGAGANQAWVFAVDGRIMCLRRSTTAAVLEVCTPV